MALNLVKLQDDLKNVDVNTLINYAQEAQNPISNVPPWMATQELFRRKRMREGVQAQQGGGEQPSVVEQLVAESAPPPMEGVAALPVPDDMYSAAQGGIVGYADGGMVAFEDGGYVPSYKIGGGVLSLQELEEIANRLATTRKKKVADDLPRAMSPVEAAIMYNEQQAARQYLLGGSQTAPADTFSNRLGPQGIPQAMSESAVPLPVTIPPQLQPKQGIATSDVAAPPAAQPQT